MSSSSTTTPTTTTAPTLKQIVDDIDIQLSLDETNENKTKLIKWYNSTYTKIYSPLVKAAIGYTATIDITNSDETINVRLLFPEYCAIKQQITIVAAVIKHLKLGAAAAAAGEKCKGEAAAAVHVDEAKYEELLRDCIIQPPVGSAFARNLPNGGVSFSVAKFERLHDKLSHEDFDRYFTVCRRRRIQWIGCPLEVEIGRSDEWRQLDAVKIWQRLNRLLKWSVSAVRELVFVCRSLESQHVTLHFKTEAAAREVVAKVREADPRMIGLFQILGKPTSPDEKPLEPLTLNLKMLQRKKTAAAAAVAATSSSSSSSSAAAEGKKRKLEDDADLYDDDETVAASETDGAAAKKQKVEPTGDLPVGGEVNKEEATASSSSSSSSTAAAAAEKQKVVEPMVDLVYLTIWAEDASGSSINIFKLADIPGGIKKLQEELKKVGHDLTVGGDNEYLNKFQFGDPQNYEGEEDEEENKPTIAPFIASSDVIGVPYQPKENERIVYVDNITINE